MSAEASASAHDGSDPGRDGNVEYITVDPSGNALSLVGSGESGVAVRLAEATGVPYRDRGRFVIVELQWDTRQVGLVGDNALYIGPARSNTYQQMKEIETIPVEDFVPQVLVVGDDGEVARHDVGDGGFWEVLAESSSWPVIVFRRARSNGPADRSGGPVAAIVRDGDEFHEIDFGAEDQASILAASFSPAGHAVWAGDRTRTAHLGRLEMSDERAPSLRRHDQSVKIGLARDLRIAWFDDSTALLSSGHLVRFDRDGAIVEEVSLGLVTPLDDASATTPIVRKWTVDGREGWQYARLVDGEVRWDTITGLPRRLRTVRGHRNGLVSCVYTPLSQSILIGGWTSGRLYRLDDDTGRIGAVDRPIGVTPRIRGAFVLEVED
ncbi:MAG: hypothetical protein JJU33_12855 [Phycisphaerales bacterium]|nr:hypothetical protein [Phycisphaerales bacterium]